MEEPMEYQELKNFGQLYTPKPSARVLMALLTNLPKELGFLGTPKFLATLAAKERSWKNKRFKTAEERGLAHKEFVDGIRYSLAFYSAMVVSCGKKRASQIYPKFTERTSVMMWEDFIPRPKDFLRFDAPWEALREYMFEFYRTNERECVWRFRIMSDTESDFQIHVTDCAWRSMFDEYGCLEALVAGSSSEVIFFPRLAQGLGGNFKQEDGCLCRGDPICDWHFFRHTIQD